MTNRINFISALVNRSDGFVMKSKKATIFKILKYLGKGFGALSLVIIPICCFLTLTHTGQEFTLTRMSQWLNTKSDYKISFHEFSGNLLNDFGFSKVKVIKQEEILLAGDDIKIGWDIKSLLNNIIQVKKIEANNLYFADQLLNNSENKPAKTKTQSEIDYLAINKLIVPIQIEIISLDTWFNEINYKLNGQLDLTQLNADFTITQDDMIYIRATTRKEKNNIVNIDMEINEHKPLLLTHFLSLSGSHLPLQFHLAAKADIQQQSVFFYDIDGGLNINDQHFTYNGAIKADNQQTLYFDRFKLLPANGQVLITGQLAEKDSNLSIDIKNLKGPHLKVKDTLVDDWLVNGQIHVNDALSNPTINTKLDLKTKLINGQLADPFSAALNIVFSIKNGHLNSKGMAQLNDQKILDFNTKLQLPTNPNLYIENPIKGNIDFNAELKPFNIFTNQQLNIKGGQIASKLRINGPLKAPQLNGNIKLKNISVIDKKGEININDFNANTTLENTKRLQIDNLSTIINDGKFTGSGQLEEKYIDFKYQLENLKLKYLENLGIEFKNASVSSDGKVAGNLDNLDIRADIAAQNIYIDIEGKPKTKVDLVAQLKTDPKQYTIDANLNHNNISISELNVWIKKTIIQDLLKNQPLSLAIKTNSDLNLISKLIPINQANVQGQLTCDLKLEGTTDQLQSSGFVKLTNGSILEKQLGIQLNNISLDASLDEQTLLINQLFAEDAEKGDLKGQGKINWSKAENQVDLTFTLNKLKLLNSKQYNGYADGALSLDGSLTDNKLSGDILWDDVNIKLPDNIQQGPKQINYVDKKTHLKRLEESAKINQPNQNITHFDVALKFPKRVFIRGKGLDAELSGNMRLIGTHLHPLIDGKVSIIRGSYRFLDKRFEITKGNVWIRKEDIELDFTAQTKAKNITAIIRISGTPENVKVSFSSSPQLPEDEVIAQILFGKDINSLSAIQAVQLANALRSLATGNQSGSSLDLLGSTRGFLKLDELEINGEEDGNISVGAGKYVTDNIYIKGEQGTTEKDTKVSVEIELSDHFSLESSTGTGSTSNDIKIFWKKDY